MITITENYTKKLPGVTSLFIKFDYNQAVVEAIKTVGSIYVYDSKSYTWELPLTDLAKLIDSLIALDDIQFKWLESEDKVPESTAIDFTRFRLAPFEYQKEAIQYGVENDKWLLLDAPGLGKTLTIIYIAEELYRRGLIKHCLVICGINTLKNNWRKEIEKCSNLSCRILGQRYKKNGDLYVGSVKERLEDIKSGIEEFFIITNIETIRDPDIIKQLNDPKNEFDMVCLDEAHVCKSVTSQQGKNLLKLKNAKYKIAATGTLLINSPLDCFAPLKWTENERSNLSTFKSYYCKFGGPFNNELIGYQNTDILMNQLESCSLRRTKDILDLPPKNVIHEYIDMDSSQSKFYDEVKRGIISQVDKVDLKPNTLLSMMTRLRQASSCPSILSSNDINCAKLERVSDLAEQIISGGDKVVIFSVYKETLNVLQNMLSKYHPLLCTGDVPDQQISQNIDHFQNNSQYKVILATTAKMGTGITLTAATYCIFVDCTYTASQNLQCEDRIYRIGSDRPVFIYYLWNNNTVDLRVKDIVESKDLISNYIVDGTCPPELASKLKDIILDLK